jgi:hypothetical protein
MCIALFLFGIALVLHIRCNQARGFDPATLVLAPPDDDDDDDEDEEEDARPKSKAED